MKVFITGGTGFIGSRVLRKLVKRGDEVHALVRSASGAADVEANGANVVWGDITDSSSMEEAMRGCDQVYHIAAWYKLGSRDARQAEEINVQGTRNVLTLAYQAGVPRIIYTSSIAVYGDTHGNFVDESYRPTEGPFITEYDRTKYMAHYKVALPLIKEGAPIIIVMPGAVYGPGDSSLVGQMMRLYYQGLMVLLPGADTFLAYTYVEDVAAGHLLAGDLGRPGESYHLTGPVASFKEISQVWARVSGRPVPRAYIPGAWLQPLAPIAQLLNGLPRVPEIISADAIHILGVTYIARADKAFKELTWTTRPVEEGMRETFDALAPTTRTLLPLPMSTRQKRRAGTFALAAAAGIAAALLVSRRRKRG